MQRTELHGSSRTPRVIPAVQALTVLAAAAALAAAGGCGTGATDGLESSAATLPHTAAPHTVAAADAGVPWASADQAQLHPGLQAYTGDGQCTTNFVFTDARGEVYLGQAAHCGYIGTEKLPNGCTAKTVPLGTPVDLRTGGSRRAEGTTVATGSLAYDSWAAMQAAGEKDPRTCAHNDFALIRIPKSLAGSVNPSLPHWGGPVDLSVDQLNAGDRTYGFGDSSLRGGRNALSPHLGTADAAADPDSDDWAHTVTAVRPGVPGDSGAGYVDAEGRALGTLSTLSLSVPPRNTLSDLSRELRYAQQHSGIPGLRLVLGTEPFHT
ncbi:hypothetical protein [Tsukamurella tyrosinosolvens]|uniref:hypothetical protein n=1 Tax=Tsukamurella tyrosinosolvens TaxID=57704 RepID=UPI002DD44AB1|nr:hypothetical protein [Tsukamurella tyrosinosolvens]MEC4612582.1 hypothetical protein [Tsukamurella tyrosinosolvens]